MPHASTHQRLPRAGIDPITSPDVALLTVAMAAHHPPRAETIAVLLDDVRRGVAIVVVSDTTRPDDVLEVVECLTRPAAHGGRVGALVLASVRPTPTHAEGSTCDDVHRRELGCELGCELDCTCECDRDVERWLELSDIAEQAGVELLEWFVITGEVTCPRDRLGEAPRW